MGGLFDLIDRLIREHGSASIMKDLLELVREEAKRDVAESERKHAREMSQLEAKQQKEILDRNATIIALQKQLSEYQQTSAERCLFCRKPSAELVDIVSHEDPDMAAAGVKQHLYRCSECGREFRKKANT